SIPKAKNQEYYPLVPSQHRIWVLSQLDEGSQAYIMSGAVLLKGELDIDKFKRAFDLLIDRHEILRTCFKINEEGEVHQYIVDGHELNFDVVLFDFKDKSKQTIDQHLHQEQHNPFDLTKAPLLKASLLQTEEKVHLCSFVMHHIIGDGWSMELLMSEVITTYNELLRNDKFESEKRSLQYKDYSVWLQSQLKSESYQTSERYWLDKFRGELPVLDLPSFRQRPAIQTYNGKTVNHQFSKTFLSKLKQFSQEHEVTLFMTLMTGVNALLYRYTNQSDIIIGTPIAGRDHPDLEDQIGLYLNTLAIRTQIGDGFSSEDLLQQQKQTLLEAYENQSYPFNELVSKLDISRDTSRSALFDVMVVLQNQSQLFSIKRDNDLEGIQVEAYQIENTNSKFDISFTFAETEGLELSIEYNTDIYHEFLIERMLVHYENLMTHVIDNPKASVSSIAYITEEEKNQLLQEFNDTKVDFPKDKTIVDLFEEQVKKTPNNIAVVFNKQELT
ncbi:condensation domain-containing protein, partial [Croceitalea marina]